MGRPKRGKKGSKRPFKGRKPQQKTKRRNARPEEYDRKIVKKQKVYHNPVIRNDNDSSDSESDHDHFTNLLTAFDVPVNNNVKDSDDSEEEDSTRNNVECDQENDGVGCGSNTDNDDSEEEEEGEEEGEEDVEEEEDDTADPFVRHLHFDLHPNFLKSLTVSFVVDTMQENWPCLGQVHFHIPKPVIETTNTDIPKFILQDDTSYADVGVVPRIIKFVDWAKLHVKPQIHGNLKRANSLNLVSADDKLVLTSLQTELFSIINNYQDLYYPLQTLENSEEIRFVYCLHAVNHILKTRLKVVHHNAKLFSRKYQEVPDDFRDQGLVRPKVLILVPFKNSALHVIKKIITILLPDEKANVMNKARFIEEFTGNELQMPYKNPRPEDYEKTFAGNTDDDFRIGLSITKKSIKLYSDFYSSDIIVASPLGLRMIVGVEGEANRDYDFLVSIELLILDQTEIFLMQNWDHMLHIMNHLHLQPKESHGTNIARVRSWAVNGLTCYYRQTLLFSSVTLPEINSLFNKKCKNYAGKVRVVQRTLKGTVCQVIVQLPQVFQRFTLMQDVLAPDARFEFFTKKVLPQFLDSSMHNVLIYIPSYFDFVRVRNYFKRESIGFVQICEYSKENKIARARDLFFHNEEQFLLYSERAHFFKRLRIKGICHLVFYQPPSIPHFYSELCNLINEGNAKKSDVAKSHISVTVVYSKCDGYQLAAIVGSERASRMLTSERDTHMFVSGESS